MHVDYNCNCRFVLVGSTCCVDAHTECVHSNGRTSFFKLVSKDYHGEVRIGSVSYNCQVAQVGGIVEKSLLGWKLITI